MICRPEWIEKKEPDRLDVLRMRYPSLFRPIKLMPTDDNKTSKHWKIWSVLYGINPTYKTRAIIHLS